MSLTLAVDCLHRYAEMVVRLRTLERDAEERQKVLEMQMEAERQTRIEAIVQSASRRIQHAGLLRGWTTWADGYREYKANARRAKTLLQVRQRLHKPALAVPFLQWKDMWEETLEARRDAGRKSVDEQLDEERMRREQLEAEAGGLRDAHSILEQKLGLMTVALEDEQRALVAAREKVESAKQLEMHAREAISKRRESERRMEEMMRRMEEMERLLEKVRRAAHHTRPRPPPPHHHSLACYDDL